MAGSRRALCAAASLLLLLAVAPWAAEAVTENASYLGCFSFSRLLYLRGMESAKPKQYQRTSIRSCFTNCIDQGYALAIVNTEYKCWCALATPPVEARLPEPACGNVNGGIKGALLFYLQNTTESWGSSSVCRLEQLSVTPDALAAIRSNGNSKTGVVFDAMSDVLALRLHGGEALRVTTALSPQTFGLVEVTARVSAHPGVITAIELQAPGEGKGKGNLEEEAISLQFVDPPVTSVGKNIMLNTAGSIKENLSPTSYTLRPQQYKPTAAYRNEENIANTWTVYTINWQPSGVTWSMNGVPLFTRTKGTVVSAVPGNQEPGAATVKASTLSVWAKGKEEPKEAPQQPPKPATKETHHRSPTHALNHQQHQQRPKQTWLPPTQLARLGFSIRASHPSTIPRMPVAAPGAPLRPDAYQAAGLESNFMDMRRIVCEPATHVRGEGGLSPPTWFMMGGEWNENKRTGVTASSSTKYGSSTKFSTKSRSTPLSSRKGWHPALVAVASVGAQPAGGAKADVKSRMQGWRGTHFSEAVMAAAAESERPAAQPCSRRQQRRQGSHTASAGVAAVRPRRYASRRQHHHDDDSDAERVYISQRRHAYRHDEDSDAEQHSVRAHHQHHRHDEWDSR